jgi:putative tryptophan/tyrosine transport system substrate-binding protein
VERRELLVLLAATLAGGPSAAFAQDPGRSYRLGCLSFGPRTSPPIAAFFTGIGKLGFVEGKNLLVDGHGFDLRLDQLSAHARELAKAGVDVIYAGSGDAAIHAAQDATRTIPILGVADDMVGSGLVQSLASPGGNTTGVSILSTELNGKRLELLLELVPGVSRLGALVDATTEAPRQIALLAEAAQAHGATLEIFRVKRPDEIVSAIERAKATGCAALNALASPLFYTYRHAGLLERCAALRLPAIYHLPEMAEDGGLIAYGPRIASVFGDQLPRLFYRLAQGARPADLPVERPTRLDLVINLKAAKALDLSVPQTLLVQASDTVE